MTLTDGAATMRRLLIACSFFPLASVAHAQPIRTEIPIREVVLSDGARRYAVPIKVGSTEIIAGLDSGSTGLWILPGVLKDGDAKPTSRADSYAYGARAKLGGVIGNATLSFGQLSGPGTVQLVRQVGEPAGRAVARRRAGLASVRRRRRQGPSRRALGGRPPRTCLEPALTPIAAE